MNRIRKRKNLKLSTKITIISILIISLTYFFMHQYLVNVNPKLISVAEAKIDQTFRYYLSTNVNYELLKNLNLEDILIINKNSAGEILTVDFDLDRSYQILDLITKELTNDLINLDEGEIDTKGVFVNEQGFSLEFPLFLASKYALLSNLGPKVYFQVYLIGTLLTNIKTKITNYGLNNALVELYVTIELSHDLISPVTKTPEKIDYEVLISSKIINGRVPAIYGDGIIKESSVMEKELDVK